jgi:DNA-binding IclR family transcriptional regulator
VTIAELAAALDVEERTIRRASADLAVTGLIEVSGPADRYAPNTYCVRL